ncbi:NADH-quinone oxidoreductase subunit A [Gordonia soli]|uniref:NADH-quinone oxidoreductase subunit A n=1 Tax=Gordonia soli NBRC 108243 TaxID=1223545 RepID=M0QH85_9ACTN|nr:NADH-quinone oxidoreductase subunit A [Gordonia soli]GAC67681.1 NADH-quinone oxidoreductase subunit A [Gordonia soli NBRC 108243]
MNAYVPILVLGGVAAAFAVVSVFIASAIGPKRYNRAKLEPYECGIEPVAGTHGFSTSRASTQTLDRPTRAVQRIPVKYYLTAMLFIIFDIEIVFLYPWAVAFDALGWFGLCAMALFIVNVSVAYAYEWRRGGLSWD